MPSKRPSGHSTGINLVYLVGVISCSPHAMDFAFCSFFGTFHNFHEHCCSGPLAVSLISLTMLEESMHVKCVHVLSMLKMYMTDMFKSNGESEID